MGWPHVIPAGTHSCLVAAWGPCPGLHLPPVSCRGRAVGHEVGVSSRNSTRYGVGERGKGVMEGPHSTVATAAQSPCPSTV